MISQVLLAIAFVALSVAIGAEISIHQYSLDGALKLWFRRSIFGLVVLGALAGCAGLVALAF